MRFLGSLRSDERGASAIEMAFALPTLLLFVYGIFQVGVIMQANAGMQHALGEGARMATICVNPTTTGCSAPADDTIIAAMRDKEYGMNVGSFDDPSVTTPDAADCTNCRLLSMTYRYTPNFLFFNGPAINLTRTKRVYLAH